MDLAKPEWKGKVAVSPLDSDFPPIVGAVIASKGERPRPPGSRAEAERARLPGRGGGRRGRRPGRRRRRARQPVLLVPPAARAGPSATKSRLWYFTGQRSRARSSTSPGAAVLASSKHRAAAEKFVAFLVSPAGQRIISQRRRLRVPGAAGHRAERRHCRRSRRCRTRPRRRASSATTACRAAHRVDRLRRLSQQLRRRGSPWSASGPSCRGAGRRRKAGTTGCGTEPGSSAGSAGRPDDPVVGPVLPLNVGSRPVALNVTTRSPPARQVHVGGAILPLHWMLRRRGRSGRPRCS